MSSFSVTVMGGAQPVAVHLDETAGATVTNIGAADVLYATTAAVRTSPDGTLTAGSSATLYGTIWLYAALRTDVQVLPLTVESRRRVLGDYSALTVGSAVYAGELVVNDEILYERIADGTISGTFTPANWLAVGSGKTRVIDLGNLGASSTLTLTDRDTLYVGALTAHHVATVVSSTAGQHAALRFTQPGVWDLTLAHGADTPAVLPTQAMGVFVVDLTMRTGADLDVILPSSPGRPGASITGAQGTTGPGFLYRGAWNAGTAYALLDFVTYNGSTYLRGIPGTTATNPAADVTNWGLMAAKGDQGIQGIQGVIGNTGAIGPGLVPRGAWNPATTYAVADFVQYLGSSYVRLVAGVTATAPPSDATNWGLLASAGATTPDDGTVTYPKLEVTAQPPRMPLGGGEETIDRLHATTTLSGLTTGALRYVIFRARKTESITQLLLTAGGAATSTTLCRAGIYAVDPATWALTSLLAAIASDTTIYGTASTEYLRSLTSTFSKVAGTLYAVAILWVGSGTSPTVPGSSLNQVVLGGHTNGRQRMAAVLASQSDLPASVAAPTPASQNSGQIFYAQMVP